MIPCGGDQVVEVSNCAWTAEKASIEIDSDEGNRLAVWLNFLGTPLRGIVTYAIRTIRK